MPREIYGQREIYGEYREKGYPEIFPNQSSAAKALKISIATLNRRIKDGSLRKNMDKKITLWNAAGYEAKRRYS